jgi:2-(1,2-epoxy-1,2-dihydrophenyl)acetyl-CoA isomerase
MRYDTITVEVESSVATITLNRPDAYNALDLALARELSSAVIEVDEDPGVRCVVLTAAGRAFCGGGDVKEFAANLPRIGVLIKELTTYFHAVVSRLARTPKPVITAVNGVAAGGGFSLAIAGDLVIAADSARFTMAYSRIGATPDGSSTYWLPRLVGLRRAMELFYTNRVLSAREALEWGLVTRVVPEAELAAAARALAAELAQGATLALGRGKRLLHAATTESLETQMESESQWIAASGHTADFAEGVRAFVSKRAATFSGA